MAVKGKGKQVAAPSSSSVKRKKLFGDEAEGSSSSSAARGSKRRRPGVLQFVDDAAVEADFDDPEPDDQEVDNDFLDDSKAIDDHKGTGKPNQLPFVLKEEELSADELEELIKDRYRQGSKHIVYDEDFKEHDVGISATDSTTDPSIWRVKCMVGRERQLAFCFMQKYVDLNNFGTKMQIISAFALDHVKGHVFVEAEKACDISEACKGFCNIYASRISLVPRSEVPHLLSTRNKPCEASEGSWVRLKSGKYKGDLAQVVSVDDGRKTVMIKLVPRVDLQAISKKLGGGISLKHAPVPAPRLINLHELEEFRSHIEIKRDRQTGDLFEVFDGLMLKDGYLYKKVSVGSLIYWGVQPSDAELLKFSKTSKDEEEDLDWVSSVYVGKRKNIAEEWDHKAAATKENVFNLHDLVLFGRKDFGVIIAIEKDGLRLLKGDMEGYEVVTVRKEDIKSGCVDKMFTALDRNMKTISINDIVKVTEGPMQGKEGTVKHMYKGSLFILDENETKHSGFFCAKSNSCENMKEKKESIGSFGEDLGEISAPSFPQSPIKSYEQNYGSHDSGKRRQGDREQMFSIGQTLRISKGPLKGYLCRVVRIYRSDVTVKLDSLVKIITVDAKFLSVPTRKRDVSAAAASDLFGDPELPSIDRSSWDIELPSFGSDSWQPFSSSMSAGNNGHKADKELESDPWCSKVTSGAGFDADHSDKPLDSWGKAAGSSGGQSSPWCKTAVDKTIGASGQVENSQKDPDNWSNKASHNVSSATSAWEKANLPRSAVGGSWGTESSSADGWDRVLTNNDKGKAVSGDQSSSWAHTEVPSNEKLNSWDTKGKEVAITGDDTWGKATKLQEKSGNGSNNWESSSQIHGKDGTFKSGSHSGGWDAAASRTITSLEVGSHVGSWDKATDTHVGQCDTWGNSKDKSDAENGSWNNSGISNHIGKSAKESKDWGQPFSGSSQSQEKDGIFKDHNQTGGWDAAACRTSSSLQVGHASSWDKAKDTHLGHYDNWGKPKEKSEAENGGWNKAGTSGHIPNGNWGKSNTDCVKYQADGHQKQDFGWNQASGRKSGNRIDGWEKGKQEMDRTAGGVTGWERGTGTKEGQVNAAQGVTGSIKRDAWDSNKKLMINEEDAWAKASHLQEKSTTGPDTVNTNSSSQWDAAASHRSPSAKQHGNQAGCWDNWEKPMDKGTSETGGWNNAGFSSQIQTSSWNRPTSSGRDYESSWSKPRNFEGGRGFGQGRGRNFGESGSKSQDSNWKKSADCDGDHRSNWGKVMDGKSDSAGSTDRGSNWNKQRDFDGGRGASWRRGRGRFNTRGGRNQGNNWHEQGDQEDCRGSGRGGGQIAAGNNWKDNDGTRRSSHGRGGGWSHSSGWNNDPANSGGQTVPRDEGSSWGNDENTGRGRGRGRNGAGNSWRGNDGTRPSSHGGSGGWSRSSHWGNDQGNPADHSNPRHEGSSSGNDQSNPRNEGPGWGNDQKTSWEKATGKWGETKGSTGW
ncbi:uncharacterized protein [Typha angustifolia]|uniref:uncharacterized protein n=1 Tax=Typha angustifolia TaxID=59011 RepID=UPI003C3093FE